MSEVNQAFLRAYLKNRASQSATTPSAPVTSEQNTSQNAVANRPGQVIPSQTNLRFDPAHAAPDEEPITVARPYPSPVRATPVQGVWSPLGAERGMKALESTSVPAIVRNGVPAVTSEAAQYRRPTTTIQPATHLQPTQQLQPVVQASPNGTNASRETYDQVMYVDGLSGHASAQRIPGTRPTARTLAEITEPIAFGTGTQTAVQSNRRVQPGQPVLDRPEMPIRSSISSPISPVARVTHAAEHAKVAIESKSHTIPGIGRGAPGQPITKQIDSPNPQDGDFIRRFDESHRRSVLESASSAPSTSSRPTVDKTSPLNTGLPLPVAFNPSWEVDQFFWPEVVKHIETSHLEAFQQIGKHLSLANRDGLKVMAVTSGERGVGRSTVAMHMARCAAAAGLRVALLDGDSYCPSLIDQLRLDMQQGWQDCLFENVPLYEIAIHSIADQITLFPLTSVIPQQQVHANLHRIAKLVRRISNAFDMVFIDANRLSLEQRDMVGVAEESIVDAAIVVVDTELSIKEKVDSAVSILRSMGISSIGLVENFQS